MAWKDSKELIVLERPDGRRTRYDIYGWDGNTSYPCGSAESQTELRGSLDSLMRKLVEPKTIRARASYSWAEDPLGLRARGLSP